MALFVERQAVLGDLEQLLSSTERGEFAVALIRGEAGAGKSALIERFRSLHGRTDDELGYLVGQCTPELAFGPFRDAFSVFAQVETTDETSRSARRMKTLLRGVKEFAPDIVGAIIPGAALAVAAGRHFAAEAGWFERLRAQSDLQEGGASRRPKDAAEIASQTMALLRAVTDDGPLVLVLEDLHWIDSASLAFIHALVNSRHPIPLLLVLTYRPTDVGSGSERHVLEPLLAEIQRRFGDVLIDLDDHDHQERTDFCRSLVETRYGKATGLAELLLDVTAGQPLFAVEYLNLLEATNALTHTDALGWCINEEVAMPPVPSEVSAVLAERLARLHPEHLAVAQTCAVQGETFTTEDVAAVLGVEDDLALIRTISQILDREHRLVEDSPVSDLEPGQTAFRFRHALIRQQMYESMGSNLRRRTHQRFAEVLGVGDVGRSAHAGIAHHWLQSGFAIEATRSYLKAANATLQQGSQVDAQVLLERAQGAADQQNLPLGLSAHLHLTRARVQRAFYDRNSSKQSYLCALEFIDDTTSPNFWDAKVGLAYTTWRLGDLLEASSILRTLLDETPHDQATFGWLSARWNLGSVTWRLGDPDGALAIFASLIVDAEAAGEWTIVADALNSTGVVQGSKFGDYESALKNYNQAYKIAVQDGLYFSDRLIYQRNLYCYLWLGQYDRAMAAMNEAVLSSARMGTPEDQRRSHLNRAVVHQVQGNVDDALADARKAAEYLVMTDPVADNYAFSTYSNLSSALLLAGEKDECADALIRTFEAGGSGDLWVAQNLGSPLFCSSALASSSDVVAAHAGFLEEIDRINRLRTEHPSWVAQYQLVLALAGASGTAPSQEGCSALSSEAAFTLSNCVPLIGARVMAQHLLGVIETDYTEEWNELLDKFGG